MVESYSLCWAGNRALGSICVLKTNLLKQFDPKSYI